MKQITLKLKKNESRPITMLENILAFPAMLDTGALIPVWTHDEKFLEAIGGIKSAETAGFSGFGGHVCGNLYHIPTLKVGELTFNHLPIVAVPLKVPCYMILSATMFIDLIFEIDNVNNRLNVTVPDNQSLIRNLKDYDDNGNLRIVLANEKQ